MFTIVLHTRQGHQNRSPDVVVIDGGFFKLFMDFGPRDFQANKKLQSIGAEHG